MASVGRGGSVPDGGSERRAARLSNMERVEHFFLHWAQYCDLWGHDYLSLVEVNQFVIPSIAAHH